MLRRPIETAPQSSHSQKIVISRYMLVIDINMSKVYVISYTPNNKEIDPLNNC